MTKQISLTRCEFAKVDDDMYEYLNQFKWQAYKDDHTYYAVRTEGKKYISMHRQIMDNPKNMEVDHIDGNGLNNTRQNLRTCTRSQNAKNRRNQANNTSGYKGVSWHKGKSKWQAIIRFNGKRLYLGLYEDIEEAARAYDDASKRLHGEFGIRNFE